LINQRPASQAEDELHFHLGIQVAFYTQIPFEHPFTFALRAELDGCANNRKKKNPDELEDHNNCHYMQMIVFAEFPPSTMRFLRSAEYRATRTLTAIRQWRLTELL